MSFEDQVAIDIRQNVFNTDEFAETVTYTPKGGVAKSIKAVVQRDPIRLIGGQREYPTKTVRLRIQKDATYGVDTVKVSGDTVTLPLVVGGVPEELVVTTILKQNAFMWLVEAAR